MGAHKIGFEFALIDLNDDQLWVQLLNVGADHLDFGGQSLMDNNIKVDFNFDGGNHL